MQYLAALCPDKPASRRFKECRSDFRHHFDVNRTGRADSDYPEPPKEWFVSRPSNASRAARFMAKRS